MLQTKNILFANIQVNIQPTLWHYKCDPQFHLCCAPWDVYCKAFLPLFTGASVKYLGTFRW